MHFIARATCYSVRAMTFIMRAMLCFSARTLQIGIYNLKWRIMSAHFQFASNFKSLIVKHVNFVFDLHFRTFSFFQLLLH